MVILAGGVVVILTSPAESDKLEAYNMGKLSTARRGQKEQCGTISDRIARWLYMETMHNPHHILHCRCPTISDDVRRWVFIYGHHFGDKTCFGAYTCRWTLLAEVCACRFGEVSALGFGFRGLTMCYLLHYTKPNTSSPFAEFAGERLQQRWPQQKLELTPPIMVNSYNNWTTWWVPVGFRSRNSDRCGTQPDKMKMSWLPNGRVQFGALHFYVQFVVLRMFINV